MDHSCEVYCKFVRKVGPSSWFWVESYRFQTTLSTFTNLFLSLSEFHLTQMECCWKGYDANFVASHFRFGCYRHRNVVLNLSFCPNFRFFVFSWVDLLCSNTTKSKLVTRPFQKCLIFAQIRHYLIPKWLSFLSTLKNRFSVCPIVNNYAISFFF